MKNALILKKIGMTQLIDPKGIVTSVTVLENVVAKVIELRSKEKHNYESLVIGYDEAEEQSINNAKKGHFKKLKSSTFNSVRELRFSSDIKLDFDNIENNTSLINLDSFNEADRVNFRGNSKGKGFQGTIKAHGFSRGPMSHGSKNHRLPGSIGAGTDPARVFKGTKMGKRCGAKQVTIKNLSIMKIESEKNLVFVKGSIPGNPEELLLMYK